MAIMVQMQFESAVTEMYQDAFVGSSIENGATIITFDLRQRDLQQELGATSTLSWRKEAYHVDIHELSTFHNPMIFASLFLIPITKSSLKRWIDDIGSHLPAPEEMLRQLLALTPATECHIDGYYPRGTDHCVMVVKDEHDRILITHEAASENGDDARQ